MQVDILTRSRIRVIAALVMALIMLTGGQPVCGSPWVEESGHSPFVTVVERVRGAVVNIAAKKAVDEESLRRSHPFFDDLFPWRERRDRQTSYGSGFVFRPDGYILTNNHVVADGEDIMVRFADKMEYKAELVGADQATDLAVLKIDADSDLPFIPLGNSDSLLVGDWAVAIGNPFPHQGLDRTVTVGVISATGRQGLNFGNETPTYQDYIQTDASINPGNSGGPLINLAGEAIGINSAIASPTGSSVGIGFAIPASFASLVIPDLIDRGRVSRGWLGIEPIDLDWEIVEAEGLDNADGILVRRVIADTPAERGGLKSGDVVLSMDGRSVKNAQQFMRLIWQARANAVVRLELIRKGNPRTLDVQLGDRNAYFASLDGDSDGPSLPAPTRDDETVEWVGITVAPVSKELADRHGTERKPGVIIVDVDPDSRAAERGLESGMIIQELNHRTIDDMEDFEAAVAGLGDRKKAVALSIYDRGNTGYVAIRPQPENR